MKGREGGERKGEEGRGGERRGEEGRRGERRGEEGRGRGKTETAVAKIGKVEREHGVWKTRQRLKKLRAIKGAHEGRSRRGGIICMIIVIVIMCVLLLSITTMIVA